jgi:hypothetical protein
MYPGPDPFNRIGAESVSKERRHQAEEQQRKVLSRAYKMPLPVWSLVISLTIVLLISTRPQE